METSFKETLFSSSDYEYLVKKYNELFSFIKYVFGGYLIEEYGVNLDTEVVGVERGLGNSCKQVYWDYLGASHGVVEELFKTSDMDNDFVYRCIKLQLANKESIVLSTHAKLDQVPNGVICLDELYMKLNPVRREIFDQILFSLNMFECQHFKSPEFLENFNRIKGICKSDICQTLNLKEENI